MSSEIKDGGRAFPWCGDLNETPTINLGISVRDYFMAHAPAEPQPWFEPVMREPRPCADSTAAPEHLRVDVHAYRTEDYSRKVCKEAIDWVSSMGKLVHAWDKEHEKQRYIQWPAAWADAMIAAREPQS